MADSINGVRISELDAIGSSLSTDDIIPIVDGGTSSTKNVLVSNLSSFIENNIYDSATFGEQVKDLYDSARVQGQIDSDLQLNDGYFLYGNFSNETTKVPLSTIIDSAYISSRIDSAALIDIDSDVLDDYMKENGVSTVIAPFGVGKLTTATSSTDTGFSWFKASSGIYQVTLNEPQKDTNYTILTDPDQDDLFTDITAKTVNGFQIELYEPYSSGAARDPASVSIILYASDPHFKVFGFDKPDSDFIIDFIEDYLDSDFINSHIDIDLIPGMGLDSAEIIDLVDSDYIIDRVGQGAALAIDSVPPEEPNEGQLWLNTTEDLVNIYDGSIWFEFPTGAAGGGIGGSALKIDSNGPPNPIEGTMWLDLNEDKVNVWDGQYWFELPTMPGYSKSQIINIVDSAQNAGTLGTKYNLDGGYANAVYTKKQRLDGGSASG
jgi:hypothetical protein